MKVCPDFVNRRVVYCGTDLVLIHLLSRSYTSVVGVQYRKQVEHEILTNEISHTSNLALRNY